MMKIPFLPPVGDQATKQPTNNKKTNRLVKAFQHNTLTDIQQQQQQQQNRHDS
jgi:predicted dinucleotide-binding enzyme